LPIDLSARIARLDAQAFESRQMELQTERIELIKTPTKIASLKYLDALPTYCGFAYRQIASNVAIVLCSFFALIAIGCEKPEPIREYRISKALPMALQGNDRMLAAIIPADDQVWFYKVSGPSDAIEFAEQDVRKFIAAATFADGQPQIGDLPSGWLRESEKRPLRFATLLIDTPGKQLELAISSLPKSGDWDEQVAMNVNRWRGQMKLADSPDRWAGAAELKLDTPSEPQAVWVDLTGEMGAGPAMPPFAGGAPPVASMPIASSTPGATPGADAAAGSTGPATSPNPAGGLKYDVPEGWRAGKMSMMRLAAFDIGPEDQSAELTIIQAGGDLRGNVDRWLGQVRGDSPPGEVVDAALEAAEQLTVSGKEAQRFYLDDGKADESSGQMIDATIVPMENGMSMFIKATGPAKTVVAQREAIGTFLQSLAVPDSSMIEN